jgi:hypothetical protein
MRINFKEISELKVLIVNKNKKASERRVNPFAIGLSYK